MIVYTPSGDDWALMEEGDPKVTVLEAMDSLYDTVVDLLNKEMGRSFIMTTRRKADRGCRAEDQREGGAQEI
jgi:hypothetical protein